MNFVTRTLRQERGQGMTEYIIIAILVALVVMFTVNRFGGAIKDRFFAAEKAISSLDVPTDAEEE
jgi:Flp pilus assembly pilin Flp